MTPPSESIVHREVMELRAAPERVREFILTPERILDYYPDPIGGEVLEPGEAFYCRGEMGTSLLERVGDASSDSCLVLKVTTAIGFDGPWTREGIESRATFSMIEDWELAPKGTGTTLTKTWRDVEANGPEPFPLEDAVREGAIHESPVLIAAWNAAADAG